MAKLATYNVQSISLRLKEIIYEIKETRAILDIDTASCIQFKLVLISLNLVTLCNSGFNIPFTV